MNEGLSKGELWTIVIDTADELCLCLDNLNASDDISAGEKKAINAMKQKLGRFYGYGIAARKDFWNRTKGGEK